MTRLDSSPAGPHIQVHQPAAAPPDASDTPDATDALRSRLSEVESRNRDLVAAAEASQALHAELSLAMDETKQENDELSLKLESIGYGKVGTPTPTPSAARGADAPTAQSKTPPGSGVKSLVAEGEATDINQVRSCTFTSIALVEPLYCPSRAPILPL